MTRASSIALTLAAGLLAAPAAGAQITTGLTPPPTPREVEARVAAESTIAAARDSVAVAQRLDMRAWVDSAARSLEAGGMPMTPMPGVPGDSLLPTPAPGMPPAATPTTGPARRVPSVNPSPVIPPAGVRPGARPDSGARPTPPPVAGSRPTPPPDEAAMGEGAIAPDTATPLPALLALAGGLTAAGATLLRRR